MIVRELRRHGIDDASIFVYSNIRNIENKTPFLPSTYEGIRECFTKLVNHDFDQVFVCFDNNKIVGVIAGIIEIRRKQITVIGGPFIYGNSIKIADKFSQYFKNMYSGFSVIFILNTYNYDQIAFVNNIHAHLFLDEFTYTKNIDKSVNDKNDLILLNEDNFEIFKELNKKSKMIFNPDKLFKSSIYQIFLLCNQDKYNYIMLKKLGENKREIVEIVGEDDIKQKRDILSQVMKLHAGDFQITISKHDNMMKNMLEEMKFKFEKELLYYRVDF